ncbi:DUF86 domain-containing protein [Candidatus Woesearchaeota archaeon]|nr:DUF86 domain-containing protein [Candidatus Woesearchaeota archaeon]
MNERIKDKIKEIETYLIQLEEIVPDSLEEYQEDFKTKAACERYLERLVEAAEDLGFLAIKHLDLESPEEEKEIFKILSRTKIISSDLSDELKHAKGMRNVLAHKYGEIDDKITFVSATEEIGTHLRELIKSIKRKIK